MEAVNSCVFYADWLESAHTIEDPGLRCTFYEAVLQYALTGMEIETPPALKLIMTLVKKQIDRDRAKYERICERRREAGRKGGAPVGNQNARKNDEQANQANGCSNKQNKQEQAKQADNNNENVNDNNNENVNDNDSSIMKEDKIPPNPPRGHGGRAKSLKDFYQRVKEAAVPKAVIDAEYQTQYIWRLVDDCPGYILDVARVIAGNKSREQIRAAIQETNARYQPRTDFSAVRLAIDMTGLKTAAQVNAVCEEYERSASEPGILQTLAKKVEYIKQGNKVSNLAAFMRTRK